jgi:hypothetical protein
VLTAVSRVVVTSRGYWLNAYARKPTALVTGANLGTFAVEVQASNLGPDDVAVAFDPPSNATCVPDAAANAPGPNTPGAEGGTNATGAPAAAGGNATAMDRPGANGTAMDGPGGPSSGGGSWLFRCSGLPKGTTRVTFSVNKNSARPLPRSRPSRDPSCARARCGRRRPAPGLRAARRAACLARGRPLGATPPCIDPNPPDNCLFSPGERQPTSPTPAPAAPSPPPKTAPSAPTSA